MAFNLIKAEMAAVDEESSLMSGLDTSHANIRFSMGKTISHCLVK
jgi:hypothetical protein